MNAIIIAAIIHEISTAGPAYAVPPAAAKSIPDPIAPPILFVYQINDHQRKDHNVAFYNI